MAKDFKEALVRHSAGMGGVFHNLANCLTKVYFSKIQKFKTVGTMLGYPGLRACFVGIFFPCRRNTAIEDSIIKNNIFE